MDKKVFELLVEIAKNTQNDSTVTIALITGSAALIGAVSGAIVSYLVAKKSAESQQAIEEMKLKATIITTERLRALQDVRERFSRAYSLLDMQKSYLERPYIDADRANYQILFDEYSLDVSNQIHMISSMLDKKDTSNVNLMVELQKAIEFISDCFDQRSKGVFLFDNEKYKKIKSKAFDYMSKIGSKEWRKIKKISSD